MHSQAETAARPATARWGGVHDCLQGPCAYKFDLVMGQHIDIIVIHRQHRYHRGFSGPAMLFLFFFVNRLNREKMYAKTTVMLLLLLMAASVITLIVTTKACYRNRRECSKCRAACSEYSSWACKYVKPCYKCLCSGGYRRREVGDRLKTNNKER